MLSELEVSWAAADPALDRRLSGAKLISRQGRIGIALCLIGLVITLVSQAVAAEFLALEGAMFAGIGIGLTIADARRDVGRRAEPGRSRRRSRP